MAGRPGGQGDYDLRRTFATVAESLDIPAYALKRLLNHANGADVTAGYIVANVERLREPMQKISDLLPRRRHFERLPELALKALTEEARWEVTVHPPHGSAGILPADMAAKMAAFPAKGRGAERLRWEIRSSLSDYFGGDSGLFWALYSTIWPKLDKPAMEAFPSTLDLSEIEYSELEQPWLFVTEGWTETADD